MTVESEALHAEAAATVARLRVAGWVKADFARHLAACINTTAAEEREAQLFQQFRQLSPQLNGRGRRIIYAWGLR